MPPTADLTWNGLRLTLDADRAAFAPDSGDLLIADVHLGKAAAFRAGAAPVPEAVTDADLARLTDIIDRHAPRRLLVLGDLLHAREAHNPATLSRLRDWRARHPNLHVLLVRGNHDIRAGDPPADLRIDCVDPPLPCGPVDLDHHPPADPDRPTIAGHVHPGLSLRSATGAMRTRCFWFADRVAILPAFGAFTGMDTIVPRATDRVFAVGEGAIVEIGAGRPTASAPIEAAPVGTRAHSTPDDT